MSKVERGAFIAIVVLAVISVISFLIFAGGQLLDGDEPVPISKARSESKGSSEPEIEPEVEPTSVGKPTEVKSKPAPRMPKKKKALAVRPIDDELGRVVGEVRNLAGAPVADARVLLRKQNRRLLGVRKAIDEDGYQSDTDSRGRFELKDIAPGSHYLLTVRHPNYAERTHDGRVVVRKGKEIRIPLIVLDKGATVSGTVQEVGGAVLSGARLVLASGHFTGIDIHGDHQFVAKSDDQGGFVFANIPVGKKRIYGWLEGYALAATDPFEINSGQVSNDCMIELIPGVGLEGIVRSTDGTPIVGARVYAMPSKAETLARGATESDEKGAFKIPDLTPDPFFLTASAKGFSRSKKKIYVPGKGPIILEMEPNATVIGRVVDLVTREPVTEFWVATKRAGRPVNIGVSKERRFVSEDGLFAVDDVEPGRYVLVVRANGFATRKSTELTAVRGEETNEILIEMDAGSSVSGIVLGEAGGGPVSGVGVTIRTVTKNGDVVFDARGGRRRRKHIAKTDRNGVYLIDHVSPGFYDMVFEHVDYARRIVPQVRVPVGGGRIEVDPAYLSSGGTVFGVVKNKNGSPDTKARVSLSTAGYQKNSNTNLNGRFRFVHVPAGTYKLSVVTRAGEPDLGGLFDLSAIDVTVIEGQEVLVDL